MSTGAATLPAATYVIVVVLALLAAGVDLSTRRVPNVLVVSGIMLGLALSAWYAGITGVIGSASGFALGFALLLPGYLLRMTGGGDVKLVAAIGSLLGPRLILYTLLLYLAAGLLWAIAFGVYASIAHGSVLPFDRYLGMLRTFLTTGQVAYVRPQPDEAMAVRVPMAPAIAFGAIAAPLWFN